MRRKKKSGSALVLVLIFTLIFTVISGVTVLAVVGSFKANTAEEKYESLYYEADAGIEKAIALANKGEYVGLVEEGYKDKTHPGHTFDINESRVEVKVTNTGDLVGGVYIKKYLLVESVATNRNNPSQSRTIKTKLAKTIADLDVFRYTLCGQSVNVQTGASLDIGSGAINSTNNPATLGGGSVAGGVEDNANFTIPVFEGIAHSASVPISPLTNNTAGLRLVLNAHPSVKELSVMTPRQGRYYVYLVNTPQLNLNLNGGSYENMMIIGSGNIDIITTGEVSMSKMGVIGEVVNFGRATVQFAYTPYSDETEANKIGNGHSPLSENNIIDLVNQISAFAPNFGGGGGGAGPSGGALLPTDYE